MNTSADETPSRYSGGNSVGHPTTVVTLVHGIWMTENLGFVDEPNQLSLLQPIDSAPSEYKSAISVVGVSLDGFFSILSAIFLHQLSGELCYFLGEFGVVKLH